MTTSKPKTLLNYPQLFNSIVEFKEKKQYRYIQILFISSNLFQLLLELYIAFWTGKTLEKYISVKTSLSIYCGLFLVSIILARAAEIYFIRYWIKLVDKVIYKCFYKVLKCQHSLLKQYTYYQIADSLIYTAIALDDSLGKDISSVLRNYYFLILILVFMNVLWLGYMQIAMLIIIPLYTYY
jgi:hypothetical protein